MTAYYRADTLEYLRAKKVGDRIRFLEEVQSYTVQARDERWLVCTKPFNARKIVIYTIVDLKNLVRGRDNELYCGDYMTRKLCEGALAKLQAGALELSRRHPPVPAKVVGVYNASYWKKTSAR